MHDMKADVGSTTRRKFLLSTAAVAIAPALPPVRTAYVSGASALGDPRTIQAWQRCVAEEVERIVRPPIFPGLSAAAVSNIHSSRLDLLMANKPVGA
jgi:hypothetical protein